MDATPILRLSLPLKIKRTKKKDFSCNLNVYRNTHYRTLNTVKKRYHKAVFKLLEGNTIVFTKPVRLTYYLYLATKHRSDLGNICSVIDKFTSDALVEWGVLVDDYWKYIQEINYKFMGFDKINPRAELVIEEINNYDE